MFWGTWDGLERGSESPICRAGCVPGVMGRLQMTPNGKRKPQNRCNGKDNDNKIVKNKKKKSIFVSAYQPKKVSKEAS